jgi:hypothetical protein
MKKDFQLRFSELAIRIAPGELPVKFLFFDGLVLLPGLRPCFLLRPKMMRPG